MEDEVDVYDGIRAQFPISFGKQSKTQVSLETIHNATRRSATAVADDRLPSSSSSSSLPSKNNDYFPSLSTSSKAWLNSVKKPNSSQSSANPNPNPKDDAVIGPPRPPISDGGEQDGSVMIGPPRPASGDEEEPIIGPPRPVSADLDDDDDEEAMIGPPRSTMGSDTEDEGESDGEEENSLRIPLSNEIVLKGHTKVVSALGIDHSGSRVLSGSYDYSVRMYDFQGMNARLLSFRQIEPSEGHQVRSLSWSPTADRFLCVTGSAQAKIYDRDGLTLGEFVKGDMYIRDLKNTKGHITGLTCGEWHPRTKETILTSSEDGSLRIWDVNDFTTQKQFSKACGKVKEAISNLPVATNDDDIDEATALKDETEAASDMDTQTKGEITSVPISESFDKEEPDPFGLDSLLPSALKKDEKIKGRRDAAAAIKARKDEEEESKKILRSEREALILCLEIAAKRYKIPWYTYFCHF